MFFELLPLWGPFRIDLFALRTNAQPPRYFRWRPEPGAEAVNAFLQTRTQGVMYAFPPFSMLPRTILQVRTQLAEVNLITPLWRAQSWFPGLLELSVDCYPHSRRYWETWWGMFTRWCWPISCAWGCGGFQGTPSRGHTYRARLSDYWRQQGLPEPEDGESALAGAWLGIWIPLLPLSI